MAAGVRPIRAKKARYFEDPRLARRILPAPAPPEQRAKPRPDDWSTLPPLRGISAVADVADGGGITMNSGGVRAGGKAEADPTNAGLRREPGLERHKDIAPEPVKASLNEFDPDRDADDEDEVRTRALARNMRNAARQVVMDPDDGMEL